MLMSGRHQVTSLVRRSLCVSRTKTTTSTSWWSTTTLSKATNFSPAWSTFDSITPTDFGIGSIRRFSNKKEEDTFPALEKLRNVLEEYRKANFSQTLPSRSAKQILEAMDEDDDGVITSEELQHFLQNIDAQDKVSTEEIDEIVSKLKSNCGKGIPIVDVIERYKKRGQGRDIGWHK